MHRTKHLKVGLFNAGSLGSHHDEFLVAMDDIAVDIMAINETWLRQGEEGRAPCVPGYRLRHVPRPRSVRGRGGGVGFYVRCGVRARTVPHPPAPAVEQMWLRLNVNSHSVIIGTAYRPPWLDVNIFLDAITDSLSSFSGADRVILLGDFNINMLNPCDNKTKLLNNFLLCFKLLQIVTEPTHFTDHSETLIDVVCTDARVRNISVAHIPELGHHAIISIEFYFKLEKPSPHWVTYRPLKDILLELFSKDLNRMDWEYIESLEDVNSMVATFNEYILNLFDLHAPLKKVLIKENCHPWITDTVKEMIKLRDKCHGRAKATGSSRHIDSYKELKYLVRAALESEKCAYFKININNNIKQPKKLWSQIKSTTSFSKRSEHSLPHFCSDPEKINQHFLDVPGSGRVTNADLKYFEHHRFGNTHFQLEPVPEDTVLRLLRSLKSNAQGCDHISLDMLMMTIPRTLTVITAIINRSITTSSFPDLWKLAIVRPIPKVSNPSSIKELRPISLLPCLSKVLEKVVSNQFKAYLEEHNILPLAQSGFRRGHSTATALLDVVGNILEARDKGMGTMLVLLDFSRAFDSINTSLLLSKLSFYGCQPETVQWFKSYLTHRSQIVQVTNDGDGTTKSSGSSYVDRGVPQGSILGPLLFILYSADITNCLLNTKFHLYADDLQMYLSFHPHQTDESVTKMNEDLDRISAWSIRSSLVLNPVKSKYLVMGSRVFLNKVGNGHLGVKIGGCPIERVREARNLGVLFDEHLHFETHITEAVRNCFYRLKLLYRVRPYISVDMRILLCESLVLSKLNYADTVYGACILGRTEKLIQRVQNACARFCFNVPPRSHITPFLNKGNLMRMSDRRKLHLATLLFGTILTKTPLYLYNKLTWSRDVNKVKTRASSYLLLTLTHRTAAFRGSFKFAASRCWNDLPPPFRAIKSVTAFKHKYKKYLLRNQKETTI